MGIFKKIKMKKDIKVSEVSWALVPVYNEIYIDEDELRELIEDYDDDYYDLSKSIDDLFRERGKEFIYTSEGIDTEDYDGRLDKFYIKRNEHEILLYRAIGIGEDDDEEPFTVYKHNGDEFFQEELSEVEREFESLPMNNVNNIINAIIRNRKLNKLMP